MHTKKSQPSLGRRSFTALPILLLASTLHHAGAQDIEIEADVDSVVDSLVPFPFQGLNAHTWVSYDPTFGPAISRTYIRFPLDDDRISAVRVKRARLQLRCDYVLGGGTVDVHRSANDGWAENGINFAGQPGYDPQILSSHSITTFPQVVTFELIEPDGISGWYAPADIADGHVTFCLKTRETSRVDTVRFISIQGGTKPKLILSSVERGLILNGTFANSTAAWETDGDVSTVTDPNNAANTVAQLRTSSAAIISQTIDTHHTPYSVEFDAQFLTTTGELLVMVGEEVIGRLAAPSELPGGLESFGFVAVAPKLRGLNDAELRFVFDGPDGVASELLLDNIVTTQRPEPQLSIDLDASGQNALVHFVAQSGLDYQMRRSPDLASWIDHGDVIPGDGSPYQESFPITEGAGYFQLELLLPEPTGPVSIEIENPGFELPVLGLGGDTSSTGIVPGWVTMAGSGAWHPRTTQYPGGAPEGSNIAFVQNNNILRQTLAGVLEAGNTYTLAVLAGKRTDLAYSDSIAPDVYLRVGGVKLTADASSTQIASPGQFTTWTREYTIAADHPNIGDPIEIVLDGGISVFSPGQVNFDTVTLTAD